MSWGVKLLWGPQAAPQEPEAAVDQDAQGQGLSPALHSVTMWLWATTHLSEDSGFSSDQQGWGCCLAGWLWSNHVTNADVQTGAVLLGPDSGPTQ